MAGMPLQAPLQVRNAGQWAIGAALGLYFTPAVLKTLASYSGFIALGFCFALALGACCGWVLHTDAVPLETSRPASKKDPITLKYYIGVCGRTGAVFLQFYTGTTGMKADRNPSRPYLVRSCDE